MNQNIGLLALGLELKTSFGLIGRDARRAERDRRECMGQAKAWVCVFTAAKGSGRGMAGRAARDKLRHIGKCLGTPSILRYPAYYITCFPCGSAFYIEINEIGVIAIYICILFFDGPCFCGSTANADSY